MGGKVTMHKWVERLTFLLVYAIFLHSGYFNR